MNNFEFQKTNQLIRKKYNLLKNYSYISIFQRQILIYIIDNISVLTFKSFCLNFIFKKKKLFIFINNSISKQRHSLVKKKKLKK